MVDDGQVGVCGLVTKDIATGDGMGGLEEKIGRL